MSRLTGPGRRFGRSVGTASARLSRNKARPAAGRVWSLPIVVMLATGLAGSLFFMQFDGWLTQQARALGGQQSMLFQSLTRIGLSQWYLAGAGVVLLAVGMLDWSRHGHRRKSLLAHWFGQAAFVLAAVALPGLVTTGLKILIGRARPHLMEMHGSLHFQPLTVGYDFASYPSGHSTTAGAVTAVLIAWFPRYWMVILPAGLVIAATRAVIGAHYASDVVAGFTVGFVGALLLARWLASRAVVFRFAGGRVFPAFRPGRSRPSPPLSLTKTKKTGL